MRFVAVTLLLALGVGGIAAYVVHHSKTGSWWRQWGVLVSLSLVAGGVLTIWSDGR